MAQDTTPKHVSQDQLTGFVNNIVNEIIDGISAKETVEGETNDSPKEEIVGVRPYLESLYEVTEQEAMPPFATISVDPLGASFLIIQFLDWNGNGVRGTEIIPVGGDGASYNYTFHSISGRYRTFNFHNNGGVIEITPLQAGASDSTTSLSFIVVANVWVLRNEIQKYQHQPINPLW